MSSGENGGGLTFFPTSHRRAACFVFLLRNKKIRRLLVRHKVDESISKHKPNQSFGKEFFDRVILGTNQMDPASICRFSSGGLQ